MSKSLVKLLDNSLIPASVMIVSKLIGIIVTLKLFNIPWNIKEYAGIATSGITLLTKDDIQTVTSYSDFIMYIVVAVIFSSTIIRVIYLHASNIKPEVILKLSNLNLLNLIKNSYQVYYQSAIWFIFTWVVSIVIIVDIITDNTYFWIGIISLISSIILSIIILQNVYKELNYIKKHPGSYKWV